MHPHTTCSLDPCTWPSVGMCPCHNTPAVGRHSTTYDPHTRPSMGRVLAHVPLLLPSKAHIHQVTTPASHGHAMLVHHDHTTCAHDANLHTLWTCNHRWSHNAHARHQRMHLVPMLREHSTLEMRWSRRTFTCTLHNANHQHRVTDLQISMHSLHHTIWHMHAETKAHPFIHAAN